MNHTDDDRPHVETPTDLAPQIIEDGPSLPALLTEDFVKQAERGVELYQRWVQVCYRLTRESHWLQRNGRYSLQGPGAEALMNPLGMSFEKPTFTRQEISDPKGQAYLWYCEGYVESRVLGRRGWYIGSCDSRDAFFNARPGWDPRTGEPDIRKSAMTNWLVNAVTRLAGIRDPAPSQLVAAGLKLDQIATVDYSGQGSRRLEGARDRISEAQAKRFWAIARGAGWTEQAVKGLLKGFGIEHSEEIRRDQYEELCALVGKAPETT